MTMFVPIVGLAVNMSPVGSHLIPQVNINFWFSSASVQVPFLPDQPANEGLVGSGKQP
jgi:hypothetical protein